MKAIIFDWSRTLFDKRAEELYEGAFDLLQELQSDYKLALVTSHEGNPDEREADIRRHGVHGFFDVVEIVAGKDAALFRKVCEKLGVPPEETLVVGDKAHGEIAAGREAGCRTCWVRQDKYRDVMPAEEPTFSIRDIREVRDVLSPASSRSRP